MSDILVAAMHCQSVENVGDSAEQGWYKTKTPEELLNEPGPPYWGPWFTDSWIETHLVSLAYLKSAMI